MAVWGIIIVLVRMWIGSFWPTPDMDGLDRRDELLFFWERRSMVVDGRRGDRWDALLPMLGSMALLRRY